MKTLIIAATLLASSAACAATANPKDFHDIYRWQTLDALCYRGEFPATEDIDVEMSREDYAKTARGKVCLAAEKLRKTLEAKGYCTFGRSGVGRSQGTHCYFITNMREP